MSNVQIVITQKDIDKYDIMKMSQVYDFWPKIAEESYFSNLDFIDIKNIDHIVFAGMGGSGAIGDVFASILSRTNIHVSVIKGYELPKTVDKNTLTVITSISGNTDEMLKILNYVKRKNYNSISFSSGGKIEEICNNYKINYRKISQNLSPRASFVNYLFGILKVLEPIMPIKKYEIIKALQDLEKTSRNISTKNLNKNNAALDLAEWINNIPLIYYPSGLQSAAIRFKNSLQENSKTHVIAEDIIESCHNGIVAWVKNSKVQPILIKGTNDHPKTKERWDIIREFFIDRNVEFKEINSIQGNILSKIINLIYLLDYSSIYLAIKNKIEPNEVLPIDFVKKRLEEKHSKCI